MRSEARTLFNEAICKSLVRCADNRTEAHPRHQSKLPRKAKVHAVVADGYARYIVIKCGLKLVGWPEDVPFRDLSQGGVGRAAPRAAAPVAFEGGDAARLRFEPATAEDRAIAERDPASAIPNGATLASQGSQSPRITRAPLVVKALVQHPLTLDVVGIARTSTKRRERAGARQTSGSLGSRSSGTTLEAPTAADAPGVEPTAARGLTASERDRGARRGGGGRGGAAGEACARGLRRRRSPRRVLGVRDGGGRDQRVFGV
ncbi:hypothetical protein C2E23DRAFT_738008 [Lenzites betulinus]|nr:hypothetical protein C2E23DRAFT_738008 [Lenzites betulinus]